MQLAALRQIFVLCFKYLRKSANIMNIVTLALACLNVSAFRVFEREYTQPCDGNLYGLTDIAHHQIIKPVYGRIEYLGHGLFCCWGKSRFDRFEYSLERSLFNNNGKLLPVKVPEGSKFYSIAWLGQKSESDVSTIYDALPPDALICFIKDNKLGVCKVSGALFEPAMYNNITYVNSGKVLMVKSGSSVHTKPAVTLLDCATLNTRDISDTFDHYEQRLDFAGGLSPCRGRGAASNLYGYCDFTGKFVIEPQFAAASPFVNEMASVTLRSGPKEKIRKVVIDKCGRIISPPELDVEDFHGDLAVATKVVNGVVKYGVVNRHFEFVIAPVYSGLFPASRYIYVADAPASYYLQNTPEFFATRFVKGQRQELILPSGDVLLTLPNGFAYNHLESNGLLRCYVNPTNFGPKGHITHLDLKGREVKLFDARPEDKTDLGGGHSSYWPIAPGRVLQTVKQDNGSFDPRYWKSGRHFPIDRLDMFRRFLQDYNLIGMQRQELCQLLGPENPAESMMQSDNRALKSEAEKDSKPEQYTYIISSGCLADQVPRVVVSLENDRVKSWHLWSYGKSSPVYTTNVLLEKDVSFEVLNSVIGLKTQRK
jgi:hypothetical protein